MPTTVLAYQFPKPPAQLFLSAVLPFDESVCQHWLCPSCNVQKEVLHMIDNYRTFV